MLCPLNEFINLTRDIIPTNLESCNKGRDFVNYGSDIDKIIKKRKESTEIFPIE